MKKIIKDCVYTNGNTRIIYDIDYDKRKNLYLYIEGGRLLIKAPPKANRDFIDKSITSKLTWILSKFEQSAKKNGEGLNYFFLFGEKFPLVIEQSSALSYSFDGQVMNITVDECLDISQQVSDQLDLFYKKTTQKEAKNSLTRMENLTGFKANKLSVRKTKTRWGSCSSKGNISINQNIARYPIKAMDYVMLHELCHLKHMNHSKEFWLLVAKYMPDYMYYRKMLKKKLYD